MGTESLRQEGACRVFRRAPRLRSGVTRSALVATSRPHPRPHADSDGGGREQGRPCANRTPAFPKGRRRVAERRRAPIVHPHARRHILEATSGKRLSDELPPPNGAAREAPRHRAIATSTAPPAEEVAGKQRKDRPRTGQRRKKPSGRETDS